MITPTAESPILIVGAGPVGLLIAVGLQRHGVPVQLLERRFHQPHPSRASTFQPAVLDCLDSFGLLRGLEHLGRRVEHMAAWDLDADTHHDVSLLALGSSTAHPYRLHLEQGHLIDALEQRFERGSPGSLHRGLTVQHCHPSALNSDATGVVLEATDANGQRHRFSGSWLIATDGAHSQLRQSAGLAFEGVDLEAPVVRLYLRELPSVLAEKFAPLTYLRRGRRSLSCLQMLQGWRFILRPRQDEVAAALATTSEPSEESTVACASVWSVAYLQDLFQGLVDPHLWQQLLIGQDHYFVAQRQVMSHCRGRLLLAGDAAHITNTRGGLNMNFGLLEGMDLAEAIACWWHRRTIDLANTDPINRWAQCWQQRVAEVLMPRTARMSAVASVFDLSGDVDSAVRQQWLRQITLLDLAAQG